MSTTYTDQRIFKFDDSVPERALAVYSGTVVLEVSMNKGDTWVVDQDSPLGVGTYVMMTRNLWVRLTPSSAEYSLDEGGTL